MVTLSRGLMPLRARPAGSPKTWNLKRNCAVVLTLLPPRPWPEGDDRTPTELQGLRQTVEILHNWVPVVCLV